MKGIIVLRTFNLYNHGYWTTSIYFGTLTYLSCYLFLSSRKLYISVKRGKGIVDSSCLEKPESQPKNSEPKLTQPEPKLARTQTQTLKKTNLNLKRPKHKLEKTQT